MARRARFDFRPNCSSGAIVFAVGCLAFLSGLFLENGGAVALGAALTALPGWVWLRLRGAAAEVTLTKSAPDAAYEGEVVTVTVTLHNDSARPLHHPRFSELVEAEGDARKDVVFPELVPPRDAVRGAYRARLVEPRGRYRFGPAAVRLSDPFGWFEIQGNLSATSVLTVYPRPRDFGLREALGGAALRATSEILRAGPGESTEFWSVREYRRGDAMRRVHWPSSARRGTLVVREFGRPGSGDVVVVVDRHREFEGAGRRHGAFENAIRVVASVVESGLEAGRRVRLLDQDGAFGPDPATRGLGLIDYLEPLVDVAADSERRLPDYLPRIESAFGDAALVIVPIHAGLFEAADVAPTLGRLAARGRRVLAVLFESARDDTALPRRSLEARLRRRGVETFAVAPGRLELEERERAS